MRLSDEEQRMLDGVYGEMTRKNMKVLVTLGKIFGAERMIKINNVHTPGVSYRVTGDAGLNYVKEASQSVKFKIPATLNTIGIDYENWENVGFPAEFSNKQMELCECYKKMGAITTNTCTPYFVGSVPSFGEHIAWGESSAIVFANSVLGARTNREGGPTALAAAITGRVPEYGLHLDENRKGTHLIRVEKQPETDKDYAVLGYFAGLLVGQDIPVFEGIKSRPSIENLKALGAALASSGAAALFHMIGITPEASRKSDVVRSNVDAVMFGQDEHDRVCEKFYLTGAIDFVVLGCPHTSIIEIRDIAKMIAGKKIKTGLWVCASRQVKSLADTMGYSKMITDAGGEIICDTCPVLCATLTERKYQTVATNSGKMAHYAPGLWNMQPLLLDTSDCIKSAVSGEWRG
ncbi:MAG: aconitase X catalytic domain-containing protein [Synergistaceae bacterium]|jgi:predicted aconitase|nr:aconitase X catalytic domain-containing protein [Synergistaceae bacterium]